MIGRARALVATRRIALLLMSAAVGIGPVSRAPAAAVAPASYTWRLPRGFPTPAVPPDNPMSESKVALGRRLFFDSRLSVTGHYSCASCHDPARSFSDGRPNAVGALGDALPRNAMALVNVAYNISFGWAKPDVRSLEAQMREPLLSSHPVELGLAGHEGPVVAQLASDPSYAQAFEAAFPDDGAAVTLDHLIKAIAAFERTLISGNSPFDRYVFQGDHNALSESAKRGMALFFAPSAGCSGCHSGFNFIGTWRDSEGETGKPAYASDGVAARPMRVPTLRNIALSGPYMHDGRFPTLDAVIDHYFGLGMGAIRYDRRLPRISLDMQQKADLIAFLKSLTDEDFVRRFAAATVPSGDSHP
ncbi:MAG TPA: cytochrome c peroxidase [Steroidobacteraceae bacterium]